MGEGLSFLSYQGARESLANLCCDGFFNWKVSFSSAKRGKQEVARGFFNASRVGIYKARDTRAGRELKRKSDIKN